MAWYLYKAAQGVSDPGTREPVSMDMVSDGETSSVSEDETAPESRAEDLVARLASLVYLMTPALCRPLSPLAILASNIRIHCGSTILFVHGANTTRFFHSS